MGTPRTPNKVKSAVSFFENKNKEIADSVIRKHSYSVRKSKSVKWHADIDKTKNDTRNNQTVIVQESSTDDVIIGNKDVSLEQTDERYQDCFTRSESVEKGAKYTTDESNDNTDNDEEPEYRSHKDSYEYMRKTSIKVESVENLAEFNERSTQRQPASHTSGSSTENKIKWCEPDSDSEKKTEENNRHTTTHTKSEETAYPSTSQEYYRKKQNAGNEGRSSSESKENREADDPYESSSSFSNEDIRSTRRNAYNTYIDDEDSDRSEDDYAGNEEENACQVDQKRPVKPFELPPMHNLKDQVEHINFARTMILEHIGSEPLNEQVYQELKKMLMSFLTQLLSMTKNNKKKKKIEEQITLVRGVIAVLDEKYSKIL